MNHPDPFPDLLPLYAAGQLAAGRRAQIEEHVRECPSCAADLALWTATAAVIRAANIEVHAPPLRAAAPERSFSGAVRRAAALIRAQAALVRTGLFPASALVMLLGVCATLVAQKMAAFYFMAPMIAAGCLSLIYSRHDDPCAELMLATPTSPWKILLSRLALVSAYNLALALAADVCLQALLPPEVVGPVVIGWLAPLAFLSSVALLLSMWMGAGPALAISYIAWVVQWIPPAGFLLGAYRAFWRNPALLTFFALVLLLAALWSAGRAAAPESRAAESHS